MDTSVKIIQIYRDYYINSNAKLQNVLLRNIVDQLLKLATNFEIIYFTHVFMSK